MKAKFDLTVKNAVCFTLKDPGDIQDYALRWLHLTNNAREYPSMILKIWNNREYVYVLSTKKVEKNVHNYLEDLGYEIVEESDEQVIVPVLVDDENWDGVMDFIDLHFVLKPEF